MAKRVSQRRVGVALFLVAMAMIMMIPTAFAVGGPGGGGEESTLGNNLSVPAIFVGNTASAPALRVACGPTTTPQDPTGPQSTQFPGYWLQKTEATWSAACSTATSATATAEWGANLTDSPSLAAGKPIRVEVSLLDTAATGLTGYKVVNLTPELADRLSTYGTDGTKFLSGVDGGALTRIWGPNTYLKIEQKQANGTYTQISYQAMTAEINSTGAVVYGYNWGSRGRANTPAAGIYRLTFSVDPAVKITAVDPGTNVNPVVGADGSSTSIEITLTAANRGGGGGGGGGH